MFRATMCPSSGEITVSMRHWYLSLCVGGVWSAGWSFTPTSRPDAISGSLGRKVYWRAKFRVKRTTEITRDVRPKNLNSDLV